MTWNNYMKNYGYREYPCSDHGRPFCEECYGLDPLGENSPKPEIGGETPNGCWECGQVGFHKMSCDSRGQPRAGSTVCVHMNEPLDCPQGCQLDKPKEIG